MADWAQTATQSRFICASSSQKKKPSHEHLSSCVLEWERGLVCGNKQPENKKLVFVNHDSVCAISKSRITWSVDEVALSKAGYLDPFQEKDCWCNVGL